MFAVRISKRRAIAARLLVFLLPILALLAQAGSAVAAPVAPHLVATDPSSSEEAPANVTLPSILGEAEPADGIILKSMPLFTAGTVQKPTAHPEYEIQVFQSPDCLGSTVAHGTAEALEGMGIPAAVSADSVTTFSALQVDPAHPSESSGCSNPLTYWEGDVSIAADGGANGGGDGGGGTSTETTGGENGGQAQGGSSADGTSTGGSAPGRSVFGGSIAGATPAGPRPPAPELHLVPGERSNDPTPSIVGSAPGADTVAVYAGSGCSGTPVATGSRAEFVAGLKVSVPKNATSTFTAVAVAARRSTCSDPVAYTEDSIAPRTRITMAPGIKTRKRSAVFRFADISEGAPDTTFVCKADKSKWKACASPFPMKHLKLGHHALSIRATDSAGNAERKPVKRVFIVVAPVGR